MSDFTPYPLTRGMQILQDVGYEPVPDNWYRAMPYGFRLAPAEGTEVVMYLPIGPSNLVVETSFATSMVPTLYGTVEEHSPVRYYEISIEGTTGMAPKYVTPFEAGGEATVSIGRSSFQVAQKMDDRAAGFFRKALARVDAVYSSAREMIDTPELESGIRMDQTGYMAFHNLYRFLLRYKREASSGAGRDRHPLIFFNYKDNNQYKVVPLKMSMRRTPEDPMLYNYSIVMRGYDLESAGENTASKTGAEDTLRALGLDGVDNLDVLKKARGYADQAKGILAAVGNGLKQPGL